VQGGLERHAPPPAVAVHHGDAGARGGAGWPPAAEEVETGNNGQTHDARGALGGVFI
jgi:hypothetical protein